MPAFQIHLTITQNMMAMAEEFQPEEDLELEIQAMDFGTHTSSRTQDGMADTASPRGEDAHPEIPLFDLSPSQNQSPLDSRRAEIEAAIQVWEKERRASGRVSADVPPISRVVETAIPECENDRELRLAVRREYTGGYLDGWLERFAIAAISQTESLLPADPQEAFGVQGTSRLKGFQAASVAAREHGLVDAFYDARTTTQADQLREGLHTRQREQIKQFLRAEGRTRDEYWTAVEAALVSGYTYWDLHIMVEDSELRDASNGQVKSGHFFGGGTIYEYVSSLATRLKIDSDALPGFVRKLIEQDQRGLFEGLTKEDLLGKLGHEARVQERQQVNAAMSATSPDSPEWAVVLRSYLSTEFTPSELKPLVFDVCYTSSDEVPWDATADDVIKVASQNMNVRRGLWNMIRKFEQGKQSRRLRESGK